MDRENAKFYCLPNKNYNTDRFCALVGNRSHVVVNHWVFSQFLRNSVAERFYPVNWQTGGAGFNPRSRLLTQPLGVCRGFLRNLYKYGLGSLRKISHREQPTHRPRSFLRQPALTPTLPPPLRQRILLQKAQKYFAPGIETCSFFDDSKYALPSLLTICNFYSYF